MCGIAGLVSPLQDANTDLYDALTVLQHRGQDSAGMAVWSEVSGQLSLRKGLGLVRDVFEAHHMANMTGSMGIGHVRYPTAGSPGLSQAQPMYVNVPHGITAVHNGNITNASTLRQHLKEKCRRHLTSDSDSELILNIFADELARSFSADLEVDQLLDAAQRSTQYLSGAYTCLLMINGHGMLGIRDHMGIRPLSIGYRQERLGKSVMIASESAPLSSLGFDEIQDIQPGEAVFVDLHGKVTRRQLQSNLETTDIRPCIFEWVYLARPDSVIDGASVYKARLNMGARLATRVRAQLPWRDIDVVVPVPECSTTAALQLAESLGLPYREGLVKNRYIGRTFIMPNQSERMHSVTRKLTPVHDELRGKSILLVDDSIVRGTTSQKLVQLVRKTGARQVYLASAAPAVRYPNVFGIDMPCSSELIAHDRSEGEIGQVIGVDGLVYQEKSDLIDSVVQAGSRYHQFETSIFDGEYPLKDIDSDYLNHLARVRNDSTRQSNQMEINLLMAPKVVTMGEGRG